MKRFKKWHVGSFVAVLILIVVFGLLTLSGNKTPTEVPPLKSSTIKGSYDVVVVGGDPEGVAAAIAAARSGKQTLLVDTRPELGGLMTRGWLNSLDMNYGPGKVILNKGIFQEFFNQIEGDSFDIATATAVFHQMVNQEKNLEVLTEATAVLPIVGGQVMPLMAPGQSVLNDQAYSQNNGLIQVGFADERASQNVIEGIQVMLQGKKQNITAGRVIDATQDADIAASVGVPFTYGQEDYGSGQQIMAVTLVFKLEGISQWDWYRMMLNLNFKRLVATVTGNTVEHYTGANFQSAWGFDGIMKGYQSNIPEVAMRGLNVGRQRDNSVLINALQIFGINGLNLEDRQRARKLAEQELPHIVQYMKKHIPGFGDIVLAETAPELYIRETRHIQGLYRLTVEDVLENRSFPDRIAYGSYPIDIQATDPHFKGTVIGTSAGYAIPFSCLVPQGTENLLVVGRAASFDSLAHGSARVIPVGMATGQAAGVAAALSLDEDMSFKKLAADQHQIKRLQQHLEEQGVDLKELNIAPSPETQHWAYEALKFMRHYGIAAGGYNNNYRLDEEMSEAHFINGLNVLQRAGVKIEKKPKLSTEGNALTLEDVAYYFSQYQGLQMNKKQAYAHYTQQNFWNPLILEKVQQNEGVVTVGVGYTLIKDFTGWFKEEAGRDSGPLTM
ncbi:FAD-dependent oxidoreductase [Desulfotomaculum sp. 1211_IL3151]|uniref:FAD-dependent oxidoreductase n=1 Tax=Desulfotomaculum sp. 1211_IL3151 TaxID=3084055 RepID=UPI002FD94CCA